MRAQDLMTHPAITCHINDSLALAAKKMWDFDIGAIAVVTDEGKVTGMLTDRDICMATYTQNRAPADLLINSAMSMHVITARPDATLTEVEQLMAAHQIRRIPIVDQDGKPLGMLSLNDLAIESTQPDTRMKQGLAKIAHTLSAICRPRSTPRAA